MQRSAVSNPPSARQASETKEDQLPPQIKPYQDPSDKGNAAPTLGKKKRRRGRERITANLSGTRYEVGKLEGIFVKSHTSFYFVAHNNACYFIFTFQ